jgi:hypothetical protein
VDSHAAPIYLLAHEQWHVFIAGGGRAVTAEDSPITIEKRKPAFLSGKHRAKAHKCGVIHPVRCPNHYLFRKSDGRSERALTVALQQGR